MTTAYIKRNSFLLAMTGLLFACGNETGQTAGTAKEADSTAAQTQTALTRTDWGERDGKKVELFTLTNAGGMQVQITNYGGIVTSW
ncbi:MAG TPA: hypothetical protein VHK69_02785, partial [Chitinophagaceae bacterium]|nr:hypothetical protein [Chitinophagaceae bacterium]